MGILALVNVSNVICFFFLRLGMIDKADLRGVCTDLRTGVPFFRHPSGCFGRWSVQVEGNSTFSELGWVSLK